VGSVTAAVFASSASAAPTWTQVYGQTSTTTRSLRGLALSDDDATIYGGYIQGSSTAGFARYTLTGSPPVGTAGGFHDINAVDATTLRQAEALTTDDRGIVYGASNKDSTGSTPNARVTLLSSNFGAAKHIPLADLTGAPSNVTGETIGGLTMHKSGSVYQLYVARFRTDTAYIERYVVGGTGVADATLTLDPTFDGDGTFDLRAATLGAADNLRGIEVAADGTIFVASREDNVVYRVPSSLTGITSTAVTKAMDIALLGSNLYVTQYNGLSSAVVELEQSDLSATGNVFTATGTFPRTNATEGYAGIDFDASGRMYIVDQFALGTSANMTDRILVSSPIPEPTSLAAIGIATLALVRRRRD
jgi:hypothetical protein